VRPVRGKVMVVKLPEVTKLPSGLYLSGDPEPRAHDVAEGVVIGIGADVYDIQVGEVVGFSRWFGKVHGQGESRDKTVEFMQAEDVRLLEQDDLVYARPAEPYEKAVANGNR
jgi:co-chaperonin GroES (HSP10)